MGERNGCKFVFHLHKSGQRNQDFIVLNQKAGDQRKTKRIKPWGMPWGTAVILE